MARWNGSSTQRGYGANHQQLRASLLARWRPGDPCARCGMPMWDKNRIDLGHDHAVGGYTGLEHRDCNRREGARRGNQMRGFTAAAADGRQVTCKTCGQPYHYAAQLCQICGRHYHPSRGVQYTCSRACGGEYRRRINGTPAPAPCACGRMKSRRASRCAQCIAAAQAEARAAAAARQPALISCSECGQLSASVTCSKDCAANRKRRRDRERVKTDPSYHARLLAAKRRYNARQSEQMTASRAW